MTRFVPPPPELVAKVRALADRRLTPDEFEAYVRAPMSEDEREGTEALIAWFTRRYPSPLERLRAGRRSWRNAARLMPPQSGSPR